MANQGRNVAEEKREGLCGMIGWSGNLRVRVRWCVLDGVVSWGLGFGDGLGERGRWSFEVKGWWLVGGQGSLVCVGTWMGSWAGVKRSEVSWA